MEYIPLDRVPDEDYREALEEMMATTGWQYFLSELYATSEALQNVQDINSMEELHEVRGKLAMIGFVLNYETLMDQGAANAGPE